MRRPAPLAPGERVRLSPEAYRAQLFSSTATKPRTATTGRDPSSPPDNPLIRFGTLPLRLFLGLTFIYAGFQKLTDPGYLTPGASSYIGGQLQGFATTSPLGFLLTGLALPNANAIGSLVMYLELGLGISALLGVFVRVAAIVGALLSVLLFLTASWDVQPYFLGSDSIYAVAWATIALVGDGGVFSLQKSLGSSLGRRSATPTVAAAEHLASRRLLLTKLMGALVGFVWVLAIAPKGQPSFASPGGTDPGGAAGPAGAPPPDFAITSATAPALPTVAPATAEAAPTATAPPAARAAPAVIAASPTPTHPALPPASASPPAAAQPSAARARVAPTSPPGKSIGSLAGLRQNGGILGFQEPRTGGPAVLVWLGGSNVAAYSAICTHAGCTVQYSPSQRLLVCPCHGAVFDPAQGSQVLRGPARRPLPSVPVTVGTNGMIYA